MSYSKLYNALNIIARLLVIGILAISCKTDQITSVNKNTHTQLSTDKQKGTHLFGIDSSTNFELLRSNNLEWVTMVAWGFQDNINSAEVKYNRGDSTRIERRKKNWLARIKLVRDAGFKVFLKPHVWIDKTNDGKWRSDIYTKGEEWEQWKSTYKDFILNYATLAEASGVEMFCVGAELTRLTKAYPDFWEDLITEVRRVYSGQLTYAGNWYEEYEQITFWSELDYIGVQAYFPLVKNERPTLAQINKGWRKYISTLEKLHQRYNRRILFTEMGYKSTVSAAIRPWEWIEAPSESNKSFSPETQANCYQAFFESVWEQDWFAGVHIWQMRGDYIPDNDRNNLDFTPQGKPAEKVLKLGFDTKNK